MANKPVLVLLALLAAGALFWLLGGRELFRSGTPDETTGEGSPDAVAPMTARAEDKDKSPTLFGRAREQKTGISELVGRVMDFKTGKPIVGAHAVVAGTGYGGETVALQCDTDAEGRFRIPDLPAGDAYTLHISGSELQRTLSVRLEAGRSKDLGQLWLGERGVFEAVVVDVGGKPVVGATVQVHRADSLLEMLQNIADLMEQMDHDAKPLAQARSGAEGSVRIENLDPGPILVVTRARGYRQQMTNGVMTSTGTAGGTMRIRLGPGRPVVGRVVDEQDRGIEGARVACLNQNDMSSAFFGRLFSVTDEEGHFRIDSPPADSGFAVIVAADGYPTLMQQVEDGGGEALRLVLIGGAEVVVRVVEARSNRPIEGARLMAMFSRTATASGKSMAYGTGATDSAGEGHFHAREGMLAMLFFSHPEHGTGVYSAAGGEAFGGSIVQGPKEPRIKKPRTVLKFQVAEGLTVKGRVADEQGEAIMGASITAIGGGGLGGSATTDADGHYVLHGQSEVLSAVIARAHGYVQDTSQASEARPEADGSIVRDIVMVPAATVIGRVFDPDGKSLAGVRVKVSSQGSAMFSSMMGRAAESITTAGGRFVVDGVHPAKKSYVLARMPSYLDTRSDVFKVASGATVTAPDFRLRRGTRMLVRILAPDGAAARGARVEVDVDSEADAVHWDPMAGFQNFADRRTDARGSITIEDVPDGKITVTASKKGAASARATLTVARAKGGADVEVSVSLREAFTLRGRCVDIDGNAVAGASLVTQAPADEPDGWIPTVTAEADASGTFALEGLPGVPVVLHARAPGFRKQETTIRDLRGEVELRMEKVDPDAQRRLEDIQAELQEVYAAFGKVKDAAERRALLQRMQELQKEQRDLTGN